MKGVGLTLRQLEYFIATAELGTLSAAAAQLHISQAAVSAAIANLERQLGVQLLVRRPSKPVALTSAGRDLLGDARQILRRAQDMEAAAQSLAQGVSGRLAVGCFPTITPFVMGRLLEALAEQHPGLIIDLIEDSVDGLQARLAEGTCELAILYDLGLTGHVSTSPVYSCRPYAVLPSEHPLARRESLRLAELAGEPMILIDMPPSADFVLGRLAGAGYVPDVRFRTSSVETVRVLVGRGKGWAVLTQRPVPDESYDGGRVARVEIEDIGPPIDIVLASAFDGRPTRRLRAFAQVCRTVLSEPSRNQGERSGSSKAT